MSQLSCNLILASSSPFRRALLNRLNIEFACHNPDIDETAKPGETPEALVARLSVEKARKILGTHRDAIIIGSDQVSVNDGNILGKPGDVESAVQQLTNASGKTVQFITGLAVLKGEQIQQTLVTTSVKFRALTETEIRAYIAADQPLNCAGSFKSEALGISLFESIQSDDPTALEGLPLIKLCEFLRQLGVTLY